MSTPNVIQVIMLSDGKPGHESGSYGVIKSLQQICKVESRTIQVRLRLKFIRRCLRMLLNHEGIWKSIPRVIQRFFMDLLFRSDSIHSASYRQSDTWVISAGGDTSFLNAWISSYYGVRNIFASSLRGLNPSLFTIHITTNPKLFHKNVICTPLAPSPINRLTIQEEGREFSKKYKLAKTPVIAILLGGDGAGYQYTDEYIKSIVVEAMGLCRQIGAKLIITTSRRTSLQAEESIKALLDSTTIITFCCLYNHEPQKVMLKLLGAADVIISTPDSGSMITESMATGKPVYLLDLPPKNPQPLYESFLRSHIESKRIKKVSLASIQRINLGRDTSYFITLDEDPVVALAKQLKAKVLACVEAKP